MRVKKAEALKTGRMISMIQLENNILRRKQARLELWEELFKETIIVRPSVPMVTFGSRHLVKSRVSLPERPRWCQRCGTIRCGLVSGFIWTRGIECVYAQLPRIGASQGSMGHTASFFSFLIEKESVVASNEVLPNLSLSTETLKACALVGLHLLAVDYEVGSSGSQSLDQGETCATVGVQKAQFGAARVRQVSPVVPGRTSCPLR